MTSGKLILIAGAALLGAVAGLYLLGWVGEEPTAAAAVAAVALGAGWDMARRALAGNGPGRSMGLAAAGATALAVALPALPTVWPATPLLEGDLGVQGDRIALPPGASGHLRLLVSGRLGEGGEPSVSYRIDGPEPPVEGRLERVYRQVRVGRGGRARVAADHLADWYDAIVPAGAAALSLGKVAGQLGSRLHVGVYRPLLPSPWPWGLAALALGLAAAAEARLGKKGGIAVTAGMAVAFALLVAGNATPASAVGPVLGGLVLGSASGALVGWAAGALGRKLLGARAS